ncbi:hypothetical protein [Hymenobacter defluvii]|uniref:Uncharacterized protein n=1 Tax=Hymenobacter defluvii TaxID=2054411 RepID=A0ABS3TK44_9BACT|nr:hypothetical protein [Hymenobacter defluvii]MBO3273090.1 hypothetical protein [Hymenobacter defluvii]
MIRPLTIDIEGQPVKVHRNLKYKDKGLWSVLFKVDGKEKVIAVLPEVNLLNVQFLVREGGRQRVIAEKCKNVHAFAIGLFTKVDSQPQTAITYDPYECGYFYQKQNKAPICSASHARLVGKEAFATDNSLF